MSTAGTTPAGGLSGRRQEDLSEPVVAGRPGRLFTNALRCRLFDEQPILVASRSAEEAESLLLWGVTPREIEEDRFVVLPFGTLDNPPWTVRERPAVKPSRA